MELTRTMSKLENKILLVLLLGYFRSKPVIPAFKLSDVKEDVRFICKTYFPGEKPVYAVIAKSTRAELIKKALLLLGYSRLTKKHENSLVDRLKDVATICSEPRYLFDEMLAYLGQNQISLPGYTTLQDLVTEILSHERARISSILSQNMTAKTRKHLKQILKNKGELNRLSIYKGSAKGFSPSEIDREINTHNAINDIYPELKSLIDYLQLSHGNLNYYASIIHHQSVYKIRRNPEWQGLLYLVCYLFFRYRETNDKLVTCFSYVARKHDEASKAASKQRIADEIEQVRNKLKYAGNILHYFIDEDISDSKSFGEIRELAFKQISREEVSMVSNHLTENDFDKAAYQWKYTDQNQSKIKTLRKLFLALDIECDDEHIVMKQQIATAREELKDTGIVGSIDQRIIRKHDHAYLIEDGEPNGRRFEYYLYHRIYQMLDSNGIYVTESAENKRLEEDLISPTDWTDKSVLINNTGLSRMSTQIVDTLQQLGGLLSNRIETVCQNINTGVNEFVRLDARQSDLAWSLSHRRWKEDVDNPIYTQLKHMSIIDILKHVNSNTDFLSAFKNTSTRKHNVKAANEDLLAVLFANGTHQGIHSISNSSDRSIGSMRTVDDSYMRLENIHKANELVTNNIAKMGIFKYYTLNETSPFGSVDGQKHPCRINTFKARFSAKYFRKGKGVSAMTLVSNHVPINSKVIAPNEYEGHYAFDLLYNNASDIKPGTLTSDNHGINNVNFAILDLFGYQFAPRYAKFKYAFYDQFEIIFGSEISIRLKKPINTKLIIDEWDEIQRIICSLSRKTTTQSTIIKKLSNNKRNNRTLAALHEYDRLIKCLYLLDYVDNKTLRQFVQQALNRGEAYHQLRKAISSINGNQFRGGNDYDVAKWNDCARLVANCIIYYNCALLSGLVDKFHKENKQSLIDMITNLSPVAWRHIQLSGHYDFGGVKEGIDVALLLEDIDPYSIDSILEASEAA